MAKAPDPGPNADDPKFREHRFTWNEGDIQIIKKGSGPPLLTPEELEAAIAHHEPTKQAHLAEIERRQSVDYPEDEDIEQPKGD
jgi:hypothetical protein